MTYSNLNFCWGTGLKCICYTSQGRKMTASLALHPGSGLQLGFVLCLLPGATYKDLGVHSSARQNPQKCQGSTVRKKFTNTTNKYLPINCHCFHASIPTTIHSPCCF